ncbi:hypothetical protein ACQKP0_11475 [Heyndrickxia sp. NPDC080065]|uniref:hypothetical protein n=1 Tax=Heyndrickxia sp. NPDC080065 TaxID=3390568 RepID=UPI003CFE2DDE
MYPDMRDWMMHPYGMGMGYTSPYHMMGYGYPSYGMDPCCGYQHYPMHFHHPHHYHHHHHPDMIQKQAQAMMVNMHGMPGMMHHN